MVDRWVDSKENIKPAVGYFIGFTPRSLQIFRARWSSISLCLGTDDLLF
jgi:hypothetical protein